LQTFIFNYSIDNKHILSKMPPKGVPKTKEWTIKLKNGKTTVLLFAEGAQSLATFKTNLITALNTTHPSGELEGAVIPESPEDIELAKPIKQDEPAKGWTPLIATDQDDELGDDDTPSRRTKDVSLYSLGIRENWTLAFRFKDDSAADEWNVDVPELIYYEDMDEDEKPEDENEVSDGADDALPVPSSRFAT
jgi:hypothetical protein